MLGRSLAARIVLLCVGLSATTAAVLTTLGWGQAARGMEEQAGAALRSDAELVASQVDAWNRKRLDDLKALADLAEVRELLAKGERLAPTDARVERVELILRAADSAAPEVDSIAVLDRAGAFVATTNPDDRSGSAKQRDYLHAALAGNEFVSGVSISTITGKTAIFHSVPIRAPGGNDVIGVLRSRASLEIVEKAVAAARNRAGADAAGILLDENGLVIANTLEAGWLLRPVAKLAPDIESSLQKDKRWGKGAMPDALGEPELGKARQGRGAFRWSGRGVPSAGFAQPLPLTKWTYLSLLPVATFERPAREFLRQAVVAAAVVVALAWALSIALARAVVRPVTHLTEVSRQIALTGDLTQRIDVTSSDETGELARAFDHMIAKTRGLLATLREQANVLGSAATSLGEATRQQSEFLARQATALQETQVTAQEIQQTSLVAAQKSSSVVESAQNAATVGREGETAVERSLVGLETVRAESASITDKIARLADHAAQIGQITMTVKDLADQSNMLALNAAIEAVRSGEHGKGFAVVAREIRSLADQSITATQRVREVLDDVRGAIDAAVTMAQTGSRRMEEGLVQVRSSGENMRKLATIVQENAIAARQIAATVSQQSAGIGNVFAAVNDQLKMMDETRARLDGVEKAVADLKAASENALKAVAGYRI